MGEYFKADPGVLDGMARTLRDAGTTLDSVGGSAPGTPDAGPLSGEMAELMALFTGAAGELVIRVSAAGDAVADGGETYVDTDQSAGENLSGVM